MTTGSNAPSNAPNDDAQSVTQSPQLGISNDSGGSCDDNSEELSPEYLQKLQDFVQPELDRAYSRTKVVFSDSLMDDDWKDRKAPAS